MPETASKGFDLKRKVGPLPLGAWLLIGGGIYLYLRHQQQSSQTGPGGTAAAGTTATGYGTDPAGNTGYIDPSTGYVYGSAEDVAALQSQGLVGANQYSTPGGTSGTGASGSSDTSGTGGGTTTTAPGTGTGTSTGIQGGRRNARNRTRVSCAACAQLAEITAA